jgi:hypothetical protein
MWELAAAGSRLLALDRRIWAWRPGWAMVAPRERWNSRPRRMTMAKGQKKSNKEIRKPKAEKPKKQNASNPSTKTGVVRGLENFKN